MRIHFGLTDLARTRLAGAPSPLTAATLSVFGLSRRPGRGDLDGWRRSVRAELPGAALAVFGSLAPVEAAHPAPRFLRPPAGLPTLDEELERLLRTPRREMRADLAYVARHRPLPGWTRAFADGDRGAATGLAQAVRDYHRVAVAPYWPELSALLAAERASRARQLGDGGIERLLATLHPRMRWRPPYLEIDTVSEGSYDYRLSGRGLLLAPAAFTSYVPCDPDEEQPTLYYEVTRDRPLPELTGPHDGLAALLGHSRAAVLQVIAEGVSTGQLARRVGLSPASASEHATILRRAGLITTHRTGRTTHHTLTPLGAELLLHAATPEVP
ncbi:ArsR/SmtB family transcription factor [Streptomyces sp. CA-111067]|uniref:ArsR/SmtB family transcription factor n=1 Tax=Streptomyces sp. CA-111067 TaxID=3240046 RepID=UPI003D997FB5